MPSSEEIAARFERKNVAVAVDLHLTLWRCGLKCNYLRLEITKFIEPCHVGLMPRWISVNHPLERGAVVRICDGSKLTREEKKAGPCWIREMDIYSKTVHVVELSQRGDGRNTCDVLHFLFHRYCFSRKWVTPIQLPGR